MCYSKAVPLTGKCMSSFLAEPNPNSHSELLPCDFKEKVVYASIFKKKMILTYKQGLKSV